MISARGGRRDDIIAYVTWDPPVSHCEVKKGRRGAGYWWAGRGRSCAADVGSGPTSEEAGSASYGLSIFFDKNKFFSFSKHKTNITFN